MSFGTETVYRVACDLCGTEEDSVSEADGFHSADAAKRYFKSQGWSILPDTDRADYAHCSGCEADRTFYFVDPSGNAVEVKDPLPLNDRSEG